VPNLKSPDVIQERPINTECELDETRGVLCYGVESIDDLNPSARITLAGLSMRAGRKLGELPMFSHLDDDPAIRVSDDAYTRVSKESLESGLYIYGDDPRYFDGEQLVKTSFYRTVSKARQAGLKLPFEAAFRYQPAVVFNAADYRKTVINPEYLARKIGARTREANNGNTNNAEVERRVKSSISQGLGSRLSVIEELGKRIQQENVSLVSLFKQTTGTIIDDKRRTPQNQYRAAILDQKRRAFDGMYYGLIELAGLNNNWSRQETHDAHKADVAMRYRATTPKAIDDAWRKSINIYGLYNNARLFKVWQSYDACKTYSERFRPFVRSVIEAQSN
jgi:hypothetical protein